MFPLLRRPDGRHRGNDRRNTMRSGAELDDNLAQVHLLLPSYSSKPSATHRFPESTEYLRSEAPNQSPSRGLKESLTSTYSTSTRSPHYFRHWSYIFVSWRWELGTWLLGSLAFATIIVLLLIYKDDRLTSWKSDIQITTIIAALSALAQSALLVSLSAGLGQLKWTWITDLRTVTDLETFDEASRGPYGSAKLILLGLWTGKVREHSAKPLAEAASSKAKGSSVFPRLAALGALAVILMLGFSTFVQQTVAIVLKQHVLLDANPSIPRTTVYEQKDRTTLLAISGIAGDVYMNDAVTSGLLTRVNTPSDVTGDCGFERCDWNPYWTLAVCPNVEDVTSDITSLRPGTVKGVPITEPSSPNGIYHTLSVASDPLYRQMIGDGTSNMTIEKRGTISDSLFMYYPPCTPNWYDSFTEQKNWRAYRAKFNLCLQRLNSSSYNSSMHTTVLESKIDVKWNATPVENSLSYNICGKSTDATHCVSDLYLSSFAVKLLEIFNGTASTAPGGDNIYDTDAVRTFVTDIMGPDPTACSNDTTLGFPAFQNRINNIATAMSNTMRTAPSANKVLGTAKTTAQFIQVNALWLTYPVILLLITTVFLFATIWHCRANDAPLWKSSSLALLICREPNHDLRSEREISKALGSTGMQLRDDGHGWQLVPH